MRSAFALLAFNFRQLKGNMIAIVIAFGLIILPSLYAWFSLLAFWNPDDNTGNLSVAVANDDTGYKSNIVPGRVCAGVEVVDKLRSNDKFDWKFVDKEEAVEGVKSGKYYAAIVIPETFSTDMFSLFSKDEERPTIDYYVNQKENPIAPHLTGIGASTLQTSIDKAFTKTVTDVALDAETSISNYVDGSGILSYARELSTQLDESALDMRTGASSVRAFKELLAQSSTLVDTSSATLDSLSEQAGGISPLIDQTQQSIDSSFTSGENAGKLAAAAISGAKATVQNVQKSADAAFDRMAKDPKELDGVLDSLGKDVSQASSAYSAAKTAAANAGAPSAVITAIDNVISSLQKLQADISTAKSDVSSATSSASQAKQNIDSSAKQTISDLNGIQSNYGDTLESDAEELKGSLSMLGSDGKRIATELESIASSLASSSGTLVESMKQAQNSLDSIAELMDESAESLEKSQESLSKAVSTGDVNEIRKIIGNNPDMFAEILSAPTAIEKHAVFAVENYGSAMCPFYSSLALFIGAIFLVIILKIEPTDENRRKLQQEAASKGRKLKLGPASEYFGMLMFFLVFVIAQALLLCTGDIFFLEVQCESIPLFYLTGVVAAIVFMNIIFAIVSAFGDVGKALVVILLVLQVAGSGGEMPIQLSAQIFQDIYPWLPFTHSMTMLQGAIAGVFGNHFVVSLECLMAYIVPSLILGVILRRPIIKLNEFVNRQLEKTQVL